MPWIAPNHKNERASLSMMSICEQMIADFDPRSLNRKN
jgi:hypothetical protein